MTPQQTKPTKGDAYQALYNMDKVVEEAGLYGDEKERLERAYNTLKNFIKNN